MKSAWVKRQRGALLQEMAGDICSEAEIQQAPLLPIQAWERIQKIPEIMIHEEHPQENAVAFPPPPSLADA